MNKFQYPRKLLAVDYDVIKVEHGLKVFFFLFGMHSNPPVYAIVYQINNRTVNPHPGLGAQNWNTKYAGLFIKNIGPQVLTKWSHDINISK